MVGCASDCEQQLPQSQERRISVREDRTLWDGALHGGHAVVSRVAYLLLGLSHALQAAWKSLSSTH